MSKKLETIYVVLVLLFGALLAGGMAVFIMVGIDTHVKNPTISMIASVIVTIGVVGALIFNLLTNEPLKEKFSRIFSR